MKDDLKKLIVGITGASGIIYGIRMLEVLRSVPSIETHLVLSSQAAQNIQIETDYKFERVISLADKYYDNQDMTASIASGSFQTEGMVVLPCSMKTLSAISNGYADNLIARAADVTLKEGRKLVLCPRDTPFSAIHLENMLKLSRLGVAIVPPVPAFYNFPETIDDLILHHIMKILDLFKIHLNLVPRWKSEG